MNSLTTDFAGLTLKNPIIASSCGKTGSSQYNKVLCDAGVGAIVLKSLFQEEIVRQSEALLNDADHAEAADYMQGYVRTKILADYIQLIKESKSLCSVPIIASINCFGSGDWIDFSTLIEQAGADAIELNVMTLASSVNYKDGDLENGYIEIVKTIVSTISIPVIVKLGSNITNPVSLTSRLMSCGAKAVVLFNRMYQTDFDIDKFEYVAGSVLSCAQDLALPLRWTALTSSQVSNIDVALSGGVKNGADIIKSILAGASAVEVCSAIYENGSEWVSTALEEVSQWTEKHNHCSIDNFKGIMNGKNSDSKDNLTRVQFAKYFRSFE